MKKITTLLLCFYTALCITAWGQAFTESDTFGNCETFENGLPATWQASDGGTLEISNKRYKQGTHALVWNWSNNSKITVTDAQLGQASVNKNSGLKLWLYSEATIGDSIQFVFYDASNRVRCAFYYKLNFVGWRGLWVRFWDDIALSGNQEFLTRMEIRAPQTVTSGQVYFDIVEFASSVSYKRSPSYQYVHPYPYGDDEEVKDEWAGWIYKNRYPQATLPLPSEISSDQQQVLATITTRFEDWLLGTEMYAANAHYQARLQARDSYISYGVQLFNQLDVAKDENGLITGPPLFTNKSSHRPNFGRDIGEKLCLQLALDYRVNNNAASKEKLLLLFDYMHDQGWAEGSAMETLDHQKLRTAAWVYSVYLLKDDLKQIPWQNGQSLLDREMATLHWLSYFNILFAPLEDTLEVSVDDFRSNTIFRLIYILMMDNTDPAKMQYMNHYTQWLNRNLRTFEGWTGGLKPDGMGYHHRGPYMNAYSNNGVHCMTQVLYFLRHTPYDANAEAKENIKKYLLNYRLISQYYDVPKGVSGRISGLDKATSMISPMAYMAQSMDQSRIDGDLASAMMRLWQPANAPINDLINNGSMAITLQNTPGELEAILSIANQAITPEEEPTGFWVKPYAAMAIFRGTDWFVSVKGTSAYIWDTESGTNENTYGRYDSHGQMEIINNTAPYPSMVHSGYDYFNGWNWSRIPGTTSINLALPQLKSNIQRVFSPNTFVGGVHQDNKCGVWAMTYEDSHYGTGLQFKKSIFFFESGLMVCLGSDISSTYPSKTQSTLLQNVLSSSDYIFAVNGKTVSETNYAYMPQNSAATLLDNQGKGIYVPMDTHLNITRGIQNSETMRGKESRGDVITTWFDHAGSDSYEYAILMKTTPGELEDMVATPSYKVIRRDEKAHIVSLPEKKQTAYALFDSEVELSSGLIKSSTHPIMAMVSTQANGHQKVSICNPDFNRNKPKDIGDVNTFDELFGPFQPQTLQLELREAWNVETLPANMKIIAKSAETTLLEIETHDAQTYTITLLPDTSTSIFHSDVDQQVAWPNPVTQDIHFHSAEQAQIFTLAGILLASGENISSFNMTSYQTGTYLLKLINGNHSHTVKIIKTK